MPNNEMEVFNISSKEYVLDRAEDLGIALPYSCRAGACSTCAAWHKEGSIDQSEQSFLDDYQIYQGFCLLCVTYLRSDSRFITHAEEYL